MSQPASQLTGQQPPGLLLLLDSHSLSLPACLLLWLCVGAAAAPPWRPAPGPVRGLPGPGRPARPFGRRRGLRMPLRTAGQTHTHTPSHRHSKPSRQAGSSLTAASACPTVCLNFVVCLCLCGSLCLSVCVWWQRTVRGDPTTLGAVMAREEEAAASLPTLTFQQAFQLQDTAAPGLKR